MRQPAEVMMRQDLKILFILLLVLTMGPTAPADETTQDPARAAFETGIADLRDEDFANALAAFEASYALRPKAVVLYNIALCQKVLGQYVESISSFEKLLETSADTLSDARREEATVTLEALRAQVARIEITSTEAGLSIYIDGEERGTTPTTAPLHLNPGAHVVEVIADGREPFKTKLELEEGAVRNIEIPVLSPVPTVPSQDISPPKPPDSIEKADATDAASETTPQPPTPTPASSRGSNRLLGFGVAALVLGGGGLVTGAVFTVKWNRDNDRLLSGDSQCNLQWQETCETYHRFYADAMIRDEALLITGYALGGTFAVAGVVLMVMHRREKRRNLSASPVPGGVAVYF